MKPGKYVVAVSGGVDSMVLLDILASQLGAKIIVAHFNHGIRSDAQIDEELVVQTSKKHGLPIEIGRANLGPEASEAAARQVRYKFLENVKKKYGASAIITAHHQDDLIETAFINILRGTGPRGLTAISNNTGVLRPLLKVGKNEIIEYAKKNNIKWHEDSTNSDDKYLRNYLRLKVIPNLSTRQRDNLLENLSNLASNTQVKTEALQDLNGYLATKDGIIRSRLSVLSNDVASEFIAHWLRMSGFFDYDKKLINSLLAFVKTGQPSARFNLGKNIDVVLSKTTALLETNDR